jgi:hypothetical protein
LKDMRCEVRGGSAMREFSGREEVREAATRMATADHSAAVEV